MKNLIKNYADFAKQELNKISSKIDADFESAKDTLKEIEFDYFTNESPYLGDVKNKIFLTYSNHYSANSGVDMSINRLNHAHADYEDRGYLKGVAVDLYNFMKLKGLFSDIFYYDSLYIKRPKFRKSKHSDNYTNQLNAIDLDFNTKIVDLKKDYASKIDAIVKEKFNLSIRYYIKSI